MKTLLRLLLALALLSGVSFPALGAEQTLEALQVGQTTYRDVRVREVSPAAIVIVHSRGIAQVPLENLSPELQQKFGYDPQRAREFEEEVKKKREAAARARARPVPPAETAPAVPQIRPDVDLRPVLFDLGLHTRDQGRHPSCAVFAVLGVLDFHYSVKEQAPHPFSEEYLVWATRQISPRKEDLDGFSFAEVVNAIRRFGVARREVVAAGSGVSVYDFHPTEQAAADAAGYRNVIIQFAPGPNEAKIDSIARELNRGFPVAVSLKWPPRALMGRVHTLTTQQPEPSGGHAVMIVGYQRTGEKPEDLLYLFRNSYGPRWGIGGYGFVSYSYLQEHLLEVLGVRAP